jgi:glycerophosphoryl diester phosphodiesterase
MSRFDLQGHRGARGLRPENTLPSFEAAFDAGATSVETDLRLTRDGEVVLFHDEALNETVCRLLPGRKPPEAAGRPLISSLTRAQLQSYLADGNPHPEQFGMQEAVTSPLAKLFAERHGANAYAIPVLCDLFAFAAAYAGDLGRQAGKTEEQRAKAAQVRFDLEVKRTPFRPKFIGDGFDGDSPGLLEDRLVQEVLTAGVVGRTSVRSFDHRSVRAVRRLEPRLNAGVLIAETAPVSPAALAEQADAQDYCPDFRFLDQRIVEQCHAQGVRVLPWTVNETGDWQRLLDLGVDGITTDYPDRLAEFLRSKQISLSDPSRDSASGSSSTP